MEKTEWMKQVVRAGREFHVRQKGSSQTQYIGSFFCTSVVGSLCRLLLVGTASFLSPSNRGWSVCRNLIFWCLCWSSRVFSQHVSQGFESKANQKSIALLVSFPLLSLPNMFYIGKRVTSHTTFSPAKRQIHKTDPLYGKRLYDQCFGCGLFPLFYQHQSLPKISQSHSTIFWDCCLVPCSLSRRTPKTLVILLSLECCQYTQPPQIFQEHGGELANEPLPIITFTNLFLLLSPSNALLSFFINYRFEHHLNSNVPWYRLPEYHRAILNIVPEELRPYYFHQEYRKQMNDQNLSPTRNFSHPVILSPLIFV